MDPKELQFTPLCHREGNRTFIEVPVNLWELSGRRGRLPAVVEVAGDRFTCKLLPKGSPKSHMLIYFEGTFYDRTSGVSDAYDYSLFSSYTSVCTRG